MTSVDNLSRACIEAAQTLRTFQEGSPLRAKDTGPMVTEVAFDKDGQ
jgi:hypothetical protein